VFCCKASAAPTFATCPFKEYSYSMEFFCFEKGAMSLEKGLQKVEYVFKHSRVLLGTKAKQIVCCKQILRAYAKSDYLQYLCQTTAAFA